MTRVLRSRAIVVALFLLAVVLGATGIWRYAHVEALAQLERQGRADLALAADRLTGELRRFRELAVLMADHPAFERIGNAAEAGRAARILQGAADKSGALALYYVDTDGRVLARAGDTVLSPRGSGYFRRAMRGALGAFYGRIGPDGRRVYAFAAPAFAAAGGVRGAVIVLVDMAEVEWGWIGGQPPVFFTDAAGRVFLSNRSELLGWAQSAAGVPLAPPDAAEDVAADAPAPDFDAARRDGHEIWRMDWGDYLPRAALHLSQAKPVIGMTAHVLKDTRPTRRIAWLQASVFAAVCLGFGAVLLQLAERRRSLARANAQLETRVTARTAELSAANSALRREVAERQEAEAALKRAQDDLVQAGKLGALGQMSAGISHELNQPLMAIRQFADNGAAFLGRGRTGPAEENFRRISQLAGRAARIIRNLRAFARNESEPMGKVDLGQVIDTAVELTEARLRKEDVALDWQRPGTPVLALGGEVRLGQVFVNLIINAVDAMAGRAGKRITIRIDTGPPITVTVRDTGPGIAEPGRMFDPFYSTKQVGDGDGMGLGLSISYGLVQSFGGNIRGTNVPDGGAVLTVELEPWAEAAAA